MLAFSRANCTNTPQSGLAYHPSRAASAYAGRLPPALSLSMSSSDFLLLLLLFLTLPLSSVDAAPSWLGNLRPSNARSKDGRTEERVSVWALNVRILDRYSSSFAVITTRNRLSEGGWWVGGVSGWREPLDWAEVSLSSRRLLFSIAHSANDLLNAPHGFRAETSCHLLEISWNLNLLFVITVE